MKFTRCPWVHKNNKVYEKYHDKEWGKPTRCDIKLFEILCLEAAQAGLNWMTVLSKREAYRKVFAGFDPDIVAKFSEEKVQEILNYQGIIKNSKKILSVIHNAKKVLEIQKEFGSFSNYIWSFVDDQPILNHFINQNEVPVKTPLSSILSKDLKKKGFLFVGPTMMYSFMQAAGLVNDHLTSCFCYSQNLTSVKNTWHVYMIGSVNGSLYTGITTDLQRRFKEHQEKGKGARFFHLSAACSLLYHEEHPDRSSASKREAEIKKMKKHAKENLIKNFMENK
jgi:DNA-3-methyladenine glycosylase I